MTGSSLFNLCLTSPLCLSSHIESNHSDPFAFSPVSQPASSPVFFLTAPNNHDHGLLLIVWQPSELSEHRPEPIQFWYPNDLHQKQNHWKEQASPPLGFLPLESQCPILCSARYPLSSLLCLQFSRLQALNCFPLITALLSGLIPNVTSWRY